MHTQCNIYLSVNLILPHILPFSVKYLINREKIATDYQYITYCDYD